MVCLQWNGEKWIEEWEHEWIEEWEHEWIEEWGKKMDRRMGKEMGYKKCITIFPPSV